VAFGADPDPSDLAHVALHPATAPPSVPPAAHAAIATVPAVPAAAPGTALNSADGPMMPAAPDSDGHGLPDLPGMDQGGAVADLPDAADLMATPTVVAAPVPDQTHFAAPVDPSSAPAVSQTAAARPRSVSSAHRPALPDPTPATEAAMRQPPKPRRVVLERRRPIHRTGEVVQ
jgi:hypothetical protein